jgi:hypothetical protein
LLFAPLDQEQEPALWQGETAIGTAIGTAEATTVDDLVTSVIDALAVMQQRGHPWLPTRRELRLSALRDRRIAEMYSASDGTRLESVASLLEGALARIGRTSRMPT